MSDYSPSSIEPKWQKFWLENKIFRTDDSDKSRPKFYILDMFPYPSGAGLHVGHPEGYTATDILARYKRAKGFNVLHPIGWDAFGLPAEQYAIKTGTHPAITTENNIAKFREQLQALGFSYDWDREVNTTDPKYFRWTQWIFSQLYKKGLAYQHEAPVNWCPELGTVLANEEVIDGKSEVGGHPVIRKPMRQWMLRITAYADRLLEDLELVDWPDSIKEMQRNWIGQSVGAEIDFSLPEFDDKIRVFTTRPDTLFGATYMVLAPEHPLVGKITSPAQAELVKQYQEDAAKKSDMERGELSKTKTGVFTGAFAVNPVNNEQIPIWIADYVLISYGTGAIMAVPGHDQRDWEFAKTFDLPIIEVVSGGNVKDEAYTDNADGLLVNSENSECSLNGLRVSEAKTKIIDWLQSKGLGEKSINYKLRDWLFSRQRYWGEPFPIVHINGSAELLGENELPVLLPEVEDYKPTGTGEPPLAKAKDWLEYKHPVTGVTGIRETNTMPQWAGSCWYYLRYIDPNYELGPVDPEKEKYWMPVDLYVGGAEHAVLHLLYARFWHKVLFDCGVVSTKEPFQRLVNQGMILGEMEFTALQNIQTREFVSWEKTIGLGENRYWLFSSMNVSENQNEPDLLNTDIEGAVEVSKINLAEDKVEKKGDRFVMKGTDILVDARAHKMSKSRGNVINPDVVVEQYGADALRLYEMFMGPLEQVKPWSMKGVEGVFRFLKRVHRLYIDDNTSELNATISDVEAEKAQLKTLHEAIKKVTEDIEAMRFNTAISAMMIFVNEANKWTVFPTSVAKEFLLILAPFAPHLAEELWEKLGEKPSVSEHEWPSFDESYLVEDSFTYGVQINGKVRSEITVSAEKATDKDFVLSVAKADKNIQKYTDGKEIVKEIFVPKRIVNIVVK